MSSKVQVPYPIFNDIDGRALNAGYVYIGETGKNPEVYPVNVYWDEDLTIPAAQPLRTRNGYFSKNGSAGKIYISAPNCSMTVKDRKQHIIYTDLRADVIFSQKNVLKSVNTVADMLNVDAWDGMVVDVKGYLPPINFAVKTPYVGGGRFVYNSDLSGTNNNITIINGWVRQVETNEFSSHDIGLKGDGTDTNPQVKLSQLIQACGDGFTVKIIGEYSPTSNIFAQGISGLKIDGTAATITADKANWVWKTTRTPTSAASGNGSTEYYQRGTLVLFECPNAEVFGFKEIQGPQLNNTVNLAGVDAWQDGDVGIQLHMCPHSVIRDNYVHHTFAWGIHATSSVGCKAYGNTVHDVTHQSGINIVMDTPPNAFETASVYNNTIYDVGLYCIEFENYYSPFKVECYGNTCYNAFAGIVNALGTSSILRSNIYGNTIFNVYFGVWFPQTYTRADDFVNVTNNTIYNFYRGIYYQNTSSRHSLEANNIYGKVFNQYYQRKTADYFIIKVLGTNSFIVQKSTFVALGGATGTWYVDGVAFTVASSVDSTYSMGITSTSGQLLQVNTNQAVITNAMQGRHITQLVTVGSRSEAGIHINGAQVQHIIKGNTVKGCHYNYFKESGNPVLGDELVSTNNFSDSDINNILVQATDVSNINFDSNQLDATSPVIFNRETLENGNFNFEKTRVLEITTSKSSGTAATEYTFNNYSKGVIIGVFVELVGGSTTGYLTCRVANTNDATATATTTGAANKLIAFSRTSVRVNGMTPLYVTLSDTANNLAYTSAKITLIYA